MTQLDATTEEIMTRYLLGTASEAECLEVEDRFLRDADYLTHLRALEYDLCDDYLRNEMAESDRTQFENRIQESPPRRHRLLSARRLINHLDEIAAAAPSTPATAPAAMGESHRPASSGLNEKDAIRPQNSLRQWLVTWLVAPRMAWQYGLASIAALLLLGGVWLFLDNRNNREQLARLNDEREELKQTRRALQQQLETQQVEQQQRAAQLQKELEQEKERNERLQAEAKRQSSQPPVEQNLVALALTPGMERSADTPRRLVIPPGVRLVKLQLELDHVTNYRGYRVEMNTPGGSQVWSQRGLSLEKTDYGRFVTLTIPAHILEASEYELTLRGLNETGKSEVAGYYYFIAVPGAGRQR